MSEVDKAGQLSPELLEYRKTVDALEREAQSSYDRTVISLSGGALGISFAFVEGFLGPSDVESPLLLFSAWACWGGSVTVMLLSFFLSNLAMRKAIEQVDKLGQHDERPGGGFDIATATCNVLGGLAFVVGVGLMGYFVSLNLR